MAQHIFGIFEAEKSPCCARRVRVTLGNKKMCLSWREAKMAARALKSLATEAHEAERAYHGKVVQERES